MAWGLFNRVFRKASRDTRMRSQIGLGDLWRRNLPGRKIRKSKDPEAGTKLAYWRNQKVREADAWGAQLEVGEVGRGQIPESCRAC